MVFSFDFERINALYDILLNLDREIKLAKLNTFAAFYRTHINV